MVLNEVMSSGERLHSKTCQIVVNGDEVCPSPLRVECITGKFLSGISSDKDSIQLRAEVRCIGCLPGAGTSEECLSR
jgi:hypothetical protein